jgi:hypothetical protein
MIFAQRRIHGGEFVSPRSSNFTQMFVTHGDIGRQSDKIEHKIEIPCITIIQSTELSPRNLTLLTLHLQQHTTNGKTEVQKARINLITYKGSANIASTSLK